MNGSEALAANAKSVLLDHLRTVSIPARKLFAVIVREAYHGPIHPKPDGMATPPEILEACGLDVGDFYNLLNELKRTGLVQVSNTYPFEEIRLSPQASGADRLAEQCRRENIALEDLFLR